MKATAAGEPSPFSFRYGEQRFLFKLRACIFCELRAAKTDASVVDVWKNRVFLLFAYSFALQFSAISFMMTALSFLPLQVCVYIQVDEENS